MTLPSLVLPRTEAPALGVVVLVVLVVLLDETAPVARTAPHPTM